MTPIEQYFIDFIPEIPNAKQGNMFGCLCIKMPNGKAAAIIWKDNLVVKLNTEDALVLNQLKGVTTFTPMEGRPMNGWLLIPIEHQSQWLHYSKLAANWVEKLEKKAPKKKPKA